VFFIQLLELPDIFVWKDHGLLAVQLVL
jgi:hypothetical protein